MTDFQASKIHELLAGLSFTTNQMIELRTAHLDDPDGFERLVRETATANSPAGALWARIKRGEHRTRSSRAAAPRRQTITSLDQAAAHAHALYRARLAAYPPIDEVGWRDEDHIAYAVERTTHVASSALLTADDIDHALRQRIARPNLRSVG